MIDHVDPLVRTALDELDPLPEFGNGWPDVLHRAEHSSLRPSRGVWARRRRFIRRGPATVAVGLAAAAAIATLAVVGPGRTGPSLVERAAAAIRPTDDSILHFRQVEQVEGTLAQTESWQLGDPPQALRIAGSSGGETNETSITATSSGQGAPLDNGTNWVRGSTVTYCPADRTLRTTADALWSFSKFAPIGAIPGSGDPTVRLRAALESGALREDGTAQLQGQTVVKFVGALTDSSSNTAYEVVTYYVQPASLLPLRLEWHTTGQDLADVGRNAIDFTTAERLPATPENLALLDVAAQHPGARVVPAHDATGPCS